MAEFRPWNGPQVREGLNFVPFVYPTLTFLGKNILNYLNSTLLVQFYAFPQESNL